MRATSRSLRLAADKFLIVTGSAQAMRDFDWIERNIPADEHAVLTDVTVRYAVLGLMGPQLARDPVARHLRDLSDEAFPFATNREIDVGYARVLATRMTYVGELGWELYVPVEIAAGVYDALHEAGAILG